MTKNDDLDAADRFATAIDAARRIPAPTTPPPTTIGVMVIAAIAAPFFWIFFLIPLTSIRLPMLAQVLLAAIPSALGVGFLAASTSDRWKAIGVAATFGQFIGSSLTAAVVSLGMDGHSYDGAMQMLCMFYAQLPLYPLAAFFGAECTERARTKSSITAE